MRIHIHTLYDTYWYFTQCRSAAKNVGCFQRKLFVCVWVCLRVCLCVCQHDNFQKSNHRMMKLGVGALYKSLGRVRIWGP